MIDLLSWTDIPRSTETAPRNCKVIYIQGVRTSVSLHQNNADILDSDEENEGELRLPKLLEEKYNGEANQNLSTKLNQDSENILIGCQNALDKALESIAGEGKQEHLYKVFPNCKCFRLTIFSMFLKQGGSNSKFNLSLAVSVWLYYTNTHRSYTKLCCESMCFRLKKRDWFSCRVQISLIRGL